MKNFEYFKTAETNASSFYQLPKKLFTEEYKEISLTAKIIYCIFLDKIQEAQIKGWYDEEGNMFVEFPVEEVGKILNLSKATVLRLERELEDFNIIKRVKRQAVPNKIYIKKIQ